MKELKREGAEVKTGCELQKSVDLVEEDAVMS